MSTRHHNGAHGQNKHQRRSKSLSIKQRRALELLLNGLLDGEVAAELELRRETVNRWRHHHELFKATLEEEQERLWLLERAQREIEAAKRHAPAPSPPPLDDPHIEDDLRGSPTLRAALRKQALLWAQHEKAQPLTPEEEALLLAHPAHVAYATRHMKAVWNRTNTNGEPVGIMLFYLMLDQNEQGRCSDLVPFWLNQPRQLSDEEKQALKEQDMQAAIESVRELQADGMHHEDAMRDAATVYGVPLPELEHRLASLSSTHKLPKREIFREI